LQKNLFKKRTVLLKANEKNFDESMQISLKKRAEKDSQKVSLLLDEKIQIQSNLLQIVEQHQSRLLKEVYKPLDLQVEPNFYQSEAVIFGDIPEPQLQGNNNKKLTNPSNLMMKQAQVGNISSSLSSISSSDSNVINEKAVIDKVVSRGISPRPPLLTFSIESPNSISASLKTSPKKRASLEDEPPIDPNEPVYCYCKQVSWGEMVACDGPKCQNEWFHLSCVDLNAPPEGKWYCNDCKNKIK
jgi:hypothetical protein